ncbi:MAG TPA: PAS domain S-box protein [Elusimicrobiales bacterium]|nr:PAS domain S-box protein [Elusimicrobiales bacterium]
MTGGGMKPELGDDILDLLRAITLVLDTEGRIVWVNRYMEELSGYRLEEIRGRDWFSTFLRKDGVESTRKVFRGSLSGSQASAKRDVMVARDGRELFIEWYDKRLKDRNGAVTGLLAVGYDVTDRFLAENSLKESKALMDTVVENVPLMIFMKRAEDLKFVLFNRAGEELLGCGRDSLIGKSDRDLFPVEQADFFIERDRKVLDGSAGVLDIPEEPIDTLRDGRRWLHTRKVCIRDSSGRPKYLLGISEDITARKQAERERDDMQRRLMESQKMESVGRLAGGLAHDFNNLLTSIEGYAGLLMQELPKGDSKLLDVQEIAAAAGRASGLTRQLLAFSRRQILNPQVIDLNVSIGGMTKMLRRLLGETVKLETAFMAGQCRVKVDAGQMDQVIVNLVMNARDAMPKGGSLFLETGVVSGDDDFFARHPVMAPGRYALMTVRDTGCGMSEDVRSRVFEPFFTTKEKGKGTGLGLSMVYGIIKQSGGEVELESEPGRGSAFRIYLPWSEGEAVGREKGAESGEILRGSETVLLVEDEEGLRRFVERVLRTCGYTVISAVDGRHAIAEAERRGAPVDLLLTDVVMPGMSGRELAQELARRKLARRTLYMSGYAEDAVVDHGVLAPDIAFMYKPFTAQALSVKLREVLDGPAGRAEA